MKEFGIGDTINTKEEILELVVFMKKESISSVTFVVDIPNVKLPVKSGGIIPPSINNPYFKVRVYSVEFSVSQLEKFKDQKLIENVDFKSKIQINNLGFGTDAPLYGGHSFVLNDIVPCNIEYFKY